MLVKLKVRASGLRAIVRTGILIFMGALLWSSLPQITDWLANNSFGNAIPAPDNEAAVTAVVKRWSTAEWAGLPGRGEGLDCSIPTAALSAFAHRLRRVDQASVNLRFRQACLAHDLCYRHGRATYGYTQGQCDTALVEASFRICKQMYARQVSVDWCATQARKVLAGVTLGGRSSFRPSVDDRSELGPGGQTPVGASTRAEYDPYPEPAAAYVAPRVLLAPCDGRVVPTLFTFKHRPGGSSANTFCFDGAVFRQAKRTSGKGVQIRPSLPSEYGYRVSPPDATGGWGDGSLVQWCRDYKPNRSTSGAFVKVSDPARFAGCADVGRTEDRLVETPVMVEGPLARIFPAIGLTQERLTYFVSPDHATTRRDLSGCVAGNARVRCAAPLPNACDRSGTDRDRYRWFADAPIVIDRTGVAADGRRMLAALVTIFARGCGSDANYQLLQSRSILLREDGWFHAEGARSASFGEPLYWRLPESAEPFAMLDGGRRRLALLSVHASKNDRSGPLSVVDVLLRIVAVASGAMAVIGLIRLDRSGMKSAFLFLLMGIGAYGGHRAIRSTADPDPFGRDADIAVYLPGSSSRQPEPRVMRLSGGRAWLQLRASVVRRGETYFVILPRLMVPGTCGHRTGLCIDLKIATISDLKPTKTASGGIVHLPWAGPAAFSKLALIPFRDVNGALLLLMTDLEGNRTVVGQDPAAGNRFRSLSTGA